MINYKSEYVSQVIEFVTDKPCTIMFYLHTIQILNQHGPSSVQAPHLFGKATLFLDKKFKSDSQKLDLVSWIKLSPPPV